MSAPKPFLTAEWRNLVMLNYIIEPERLAPYIPAGVEVDRWNGQTFVSLVGFQFLGTRVRGLAVPGHRNFAEVNLRFYVRRRAEDGWRRGVVFIREIVPKRAIAWVANVLYNEHYVALPMENKINRDDGEFQYAWKDGIEWHRMSLKSRGECFIPEPGSQEEFITEHYWGYARQRHGGSLEYQVEHPRWRVWSAAEIRQSGRLASFYNPDFAESLGRPPVSAFLADGSPVTVYQGVRIR